jgi:hypothetical protein
MIRINVFCGLLAALFTLEIAAATGSAGASTTADSLKPASFQVRNKKFGDLLRPEGANGANGTSIVLYPEQPWKCMTWKFHPAGESAFQLQNHFTGKTFAADIKASDTAAPVTQVPFDKPGGAAPVWNFTKLPDGTYKITNAKSGKALTAVKEENGSVVRTVLQAWQDKDEQKWQLVPIDPKTLTM